MSNPTKTENAAPIAEKTTQSKLNAQRVDFGNTVKSYFCIIFIVTVIYSLVLIVVPLLLVIYGKTMDATVLAASVQVAFGMVLGFVCVYVGLMMTWLGIDAAYSAKGEIGAGSIVLKSASPGLLFALGGMVLVAVSLHKQIVYQENSKNLVGTNSIDPNIAPNAVKPGPPKSITLVPTGPSTSARSPLSSSEPGPQATFSGHLESKDSPPSATKPIGN